MANIGYIRVSTTQQHSDRQLADIIGTLDKVFTEKASASTVQREAFRAMMDYVREGDTLHVHSLDRLCRKTSDLLATVEELTDRGVTIKFHKEGFTTGKGSAIGNFMITILAGVAQMEREFMLERQREGYAAAKAAGRVAHRGKGKAVDHEAIAIALENGLSVRKAAAQFNVSTSTIQRIKAAM